VSGREENDLSRHNFKQSYELASLFFTPSGPHDFQSEQSRSAR
jgi:hypothetical protein